MMIMLMMGTIHSGYQCLVKLMVIKVKCSGDGGNGD